MGNVDLKVVHNKFGLGIIQCLEQNYQGFISLKLSQKTDLFS